MKKLILLLTTILLVFLLFNCSSPDPEPSQMTRYGWLVYIMLGILTASGDPEIAVETVGDVTTYTFTSYLYNDTEDPDAAVSGTIVLTDDDVTEHYVANLSFANDDAGLTSITADHSGPSGGEANSGTITVNGDEWPITDMMEELGD